MELFKAELKEKANVVYGDEFVQVGDIKISTEHHQDCCEHVYGDFNVFKDYIKEIKDITSIRINGVKGEGFVIFFEGGFTDKVGVFVPCYNNQNGYYSSDLNLMIEREETVTRVDLADYKVDNDY